MKEITIIGRQSPGGLWELELKGTEFRAGGPTIREAFEKLLDQVFERALRIVEREEFRS